MVLILPLIINVPLGTANQDNDGELHDSTEAKWHFGFLAEVQYERNDVADTADRNSGATDDLYLGTIEITISAKLQEWLSSNVVVAWEDHFKKDTKPSLILDEAAPTIAPSKSPIYAVIGKRTQPFGLFESHLISDPITQELYEIDAVGITLGIVLDAIDMDLSVTAYDDQTIIEALDDFGANEFRQDRPEIDHRLSFIINLTVGFEQIGTVFSSSYDHSPGDDRDNQTLDLGLSWDHDVVIFDLEYAKALQRESGEDGEENLESAWSTSITVVPFDVLELSARYERFYDDRTGQQDEIMESRYSAGVNLMLTDEVTLSMEYRQTQYEREAESQAAHRQNDVFAELAVEF